MAQRESREKATRLGGPTEKKETNVDVRGGGGSSLVAI